ncbi:MULTISPECIES: hypothetical protein [unclassified Rhizobium]|uniref:hypothetical protein n=1 Tax=unclassified Rhizobium TaxID=2613769 RepID=UPI000715B7FD|nr:MULTISPECIES: hypothetical protein [unclassified Rhizobium]KQT03190.1 hypothetical protein ASG42_24580 [Rhizobium sp. Leaf391]KQU08415.1 hypothetical protein ASG68_22780 [Rhizobium sp. Leaf453]
MTIAITRRDGVVIFPVHRTRPPSIMLRFAGHVVKLPKTELGRHFLIRALRFGDKLEWYGPGYDWDAEAKSIRDAHEWCDRQECQNDEGASQ